MAGVDGETGEGGGGQKVVEREGTKTQLGSECQPGRRGLR